LLEVCPCFKKELKAIFADENKGLREINELLFKVDAMVFFSPDIFHFTKHWGMRRLQLGEK
jgi:pantothenate kinase-related protein Tda10